MEENKRLACAAIDSVSDLICEMSDAVWEVPETAFLETESTRLQCELLEKLGFQVEKNLANIPTAFSGRWGSGKPVIGILGEFDALAGLSQKANCAVKDPVVAGGNGHGCGHNLLGAGAVAAAYGIKSYLESTGASGTVIYYGCPGEEGGSGKAFMARDGVFDELDFALTWHPMDYNVAWFESTLANIQASYKFTGVSAHAAGCPHLGRSALDAAELMNVGVQFLREHIIQEARVHYAITNTGGFSPNVVQPTAEVLYLIRAPKMNDVAEIYERVNNIARGAAMMTDTKVDIQFVKSCSNFVPNTLIADELHKNMELVGCPEYTEEELKFAQEIRNSLDKKVNPMDTFASKLRPDELKWVREQTFEPMVNFMVPRIYSESSLPGSTDVGDVSWVCPTAQIYTACVAYGTPGHSWQWTAQCKTDYARDMTIYAAKVLAAGAVELMENPELLAEAKAEHAERVGPEGYIPPIPKDVKPIAMDALRK